MSEERKIFRASGVVVAVTLLSRVTGLVRDVALSAKLGTTIAADVFNYAYELPNLGRRILGEGALSSIIVPLFSGRRKEAGEREGWVFANRAFNAVALLSTALTIGGMIYSEQIFKAFGGFGIIKQARESGIGNAEALAAVQHGAALTRLMFPQMVGLAVGSVMMGMCHALGRFAAPAMGSVMLNLTMIVAAGLALALRVDLDTATVWLAWSVLAGAAARMALMVPPLAREGWRWRPAVSFADPEVARLFRMMSVGLIGLSINHVNIAIAGIFAAFLGPGNKTALVMSNRLIQLPMALTATALATAMLPRLSHLLLEDKEEELVQVMGLTKRLEAVLMIPAMLGLMFLGEPILELLFQRGRWTAASSEKTFGALFYYAPSLISMGWVRLIIPLYHARKDVATPVKAGVVAMVANVALAAFFTFYTRLEQRGLALASTLASFANMGYLMWAVRTRVGLPVWEARMTETLVKSMAAGLIAVGGGWLAYRGLIAGFGPAATTLHRAVYLFPLLAAIAAAYFLLIHLFRVPDADRALGLFKRKLGLGR